MYKRLELGDKLFIFKVYTLDRGVVGIKSSTEDEKNIFFCDVDNVNPQWLIDRVKKMIKKFKCSHVHIIVTGINRFGLICIDEFDKGEIINMQSFIDDNLTRTYQVYGIRRGFWVQRCSEKHNRTAPKHLTTVTSPYSNRKQSLGHYLWLKKYYGIKVKIKNSNKLGKIKTDTYPTVM